MFFGYIDPGNGFNFFNAISWLYYGILGAAGVFLFFFKKIYRFLRHRKKAALVLLLGTAACASILGVWMSQKRPSPDKKIIILGFDGLSPALMGPLLAAGELPNFARLKNTGTYRQLGTTNPAQSPVAWAAFATGKNPGENGIYDFIVRDPKTYKLDLSLARIDHDKVAKTLKTEAFWQATSRAKIPTIIIGCPLTFPPDKIYGRMLSGMGVPDILGTEGTFTFYTSEPENKTKDTGGKVFHVPKSQTMTLHLIGPRSSPAFDASQNTRVPFNASVKKGVLLIEYAGKKIGLQPGHWSAWQKVSFPITPFKKMKGIFKFYLVALEPDFKLYISPIQFDPRDPYFALSYPRSYAKELSEKIGLFHTQGMPVDTWAVNEERLSEKELITTSREVLKEKKAILDFELGRFKKGVLFCYFGTPDIIQHMFWRYLDPQHPLYDPGAPQEYKDMIKTWYKKMDSILGDVLRKITDQDTLLALSDHGFATFRRAVHINAWLKENGYLVLKNEGTQEGAPLLADVDWSKTKAYAISFGAIYLNLKNRERDGIVEPEDAGRLKSEIATKLKIWTDEKYGSLVVQEVYKNEDIFKGPFAKDAPDLYVGFQIGYRASWQTALGATPAVTIEDNLKKWSGDHLFDPSLVPGIFFSNRPLDETPSSIHDLSSVILKLLKISQRS
jgi:predicted AlkP superfamily phosphohydrolase/phosphomutase